MKKHCLNLLIPSLFLAALISGCAQNTNNPKTVSKKNVNVESNFFDMVRQDFGSRSDFDEICGQRVLRQEVTQAMKVKNSQAVFNLSQKFLKQCPVDIQMHTFNLTSALVLGKSQEVIARQKYWINGLYQSILKTGDGLTPETAYKTISIAEEYAVLMRMGYIQRIKMQSFMEKEKVDRFTIDLSKSNTKEIYFHPKLHLQRLEQRTKQGLNIDSNKKIKENYIAIKKGALAFSECDKSGKPLLATNLIVMEMHIRKTLRSNLVELRQVIETADSAEATLKKTITNNGCDNEEVKQALADFDRLSKLETNEIAPGWKP